MKKKTESFSAHRSLLPLFCSSHLSTAREICTLMTSSHKAVDISLFPLIGDALHQHQERWVFPPKHAFQIEEPRSPSVHANDWAKGYKWRQCPDLSIRIHTPDKLSVFGIDEQLPPLW